MIYLHDVDPDNWRLDLNVSKEQEPYVSTGYRLLARAYAYRNHRSRAFVIFNDDTPIGMGLYHDIPEWNCYDFSQLFIDARYQGRGYGKAAAELVLNEMKQDGKYNKVVLCYIDGNTAARNLYAHFGFVETDRDGDEIIMELVFQN